MYQLKWTQQQKELWQTYHEENSYLSMTDERQVRFCLNGKMYYEPTYGMEDVNINLCGLPCCPNETKGCFRKMIDGEIL